MPRLSPEYHVLITKAIDTVQFRYPWDSPERALAREVERLRRLEVELETANESLRTLGRNAQELQTQLGNAERRIRELEAGAARLVARIGATP